MECNPGTVTQEKIVTLKEVGVNRLSIGLQSAKNSELKELGRIHTYQQFIQTFQIARTAGFTNINVDLMSALPGQTFKSYSETLQKIIALEPEHISAYSLIIEEGTPFYDRYGKDIKANCEYLPLPDEDTERKMYYETKKILKNAGYHRYEISNYAKRGFECRHNLSYWTGKDYVGFGTGAASYLNGVRYSNLKDTKIYIKKMKEEGIADTIKENIQILTNKEKMEEFMFVGLRLCAGVSKLKFEKQFGYPMESIYGNVLDKMKENKLLKIKGDYCILTKRGMDISNYVLAHFLLEI